MWWPVEEPHAPCGASWRDTRIVVGLQVVRHEDVPAAKLRQKGLSKANRRIGLRWWSARWWSGPSNRSADGAKERIVEPFSLRYFYRYELEHLLARAGFRLANLYGDFDRSPLRDDSPEMIFVAEPQS